MLLHLLTGNDRRNIRNSFAQIMQAIKAGVLTRAWAVTFFGSVINSLFHAVPEAATLV